MLYLGADPGTTGAIAILDASKRLVLVTDMPTEQVHVNGKNRKVVSEKGLWHFIRNPPQQSEPVFGVVEQVNILPQQDVGGGGRFMAGYGALRMALTAGGVDYRLVPSVTWRRGVGLKVQSEKDKAPSIALANEWFPGSKGLWRLKKHDGRAEAVLMACYAMLLHGRESQQLLA